MAQLTACGADNGDDHHFMRLALSEAQAAADEGEVPVGAVMVDREQRILAATRNRTIGLCDPSAHAEMLAIRQAARAVGNYRLLSTTLYVTVEPCLMCMGAIIHARVARIVFGAPDPKWGAAGSLYDFARDTRLNHHPEVLGGVCLDACRTLMRQFFLARRGASSQPIT